MKKLLTHQQVTAWKNRVHAEYVKAGIAYERARWREKLFMRYLYRYTETRDKEGDKDED